MAREKVALQQELTCSCMAQAGAGAVIPAACELWGLAKTVSRKLRAEALRVLGPCSRGVSSVAILAQVRRPAAAPPAVVASLPAAPLPLSDDLLSRVCGRSMRPWPLLMALASLTLTLQIVGSASLVSSRSTLGCHTPASSLAARVGVLEAQDFVEKKKRQPKGRPWHDEDVTQASAASTPRRNRWEEGPSRLQQGKWCNKGKNKDGKENENDKDKAKPPPSKSRQHTAPPPKNKDEQ